jgi:hypothetical protein
MPWDRQRRLPDLARQGLRGEPMAGVRRPPPGWVALLIAQVLESSVDRPRSSTERTSSGRNPPSPVNASSPAAARSITESNSPASSMSFTAARAGSTPASRC